MVKNNDQTVLYSIFIFSLIFKKHNILGKSILKFLTHIFSCFYIFLKIAFLRWKLVSPLYSCAFVFFLCGILFATLKKILSLSIQNFVPLLLKTLQAKVQRIHCFSKKSWIYKFYNCLIFFLKNHKYYFNFLTIVNCYICWIKGFFSNKSIKSETCF